MLQYPLAIPRSDDECLKSSGLAPIVAKAIASMVRIDGVITPEEYEQLAITADILSEFSDNKLLFRVLILHCLLEDVSFDKAISELSSIAKNQSEKTRNLIFDAVKPLLICQELKDKKKITHAWIKALNLPKDRIKEVVNETINRYKGGLLESDFIQNLMNLLTNKPDKTELAERLSNIFQDKQFNNAISKYKNKELSPSELDEEISEAAKRALNKAESKLPSVKAIEEQENQAKVLHNMTEMLIDQVRARLKYIHRRLELQHDLFVEDFREFLDSSLDSVEIGMRDLMEGHTNWADKTIWKKFSETDAYQKMLLKYDHWKYRYDRIFDLWSAELTDFSKESHHVIRNVLNNVDPVVFSGLIKTDHGHIEFQNRLDHIANTTIGLAGLGTIGTVALLLTGSASAVSAISVVVTNPVGWVIGGVIGVSLLWKMISDPEKRKREMIQNKRTRLREDLKIIFGNPITQHRSKVDEVAERFFAETSNYYVPLARDARLAVLQARLQAKVILRIKEDIHTIFLNCAKSSVTKDPIRIDNIGQFAKTSYNKVLSFISRSK